MDRMSMNMACKALGFTEPLDLQELVRLITVAERRLGEALTSESCSFSERHYGALNRLHGDLALHAAWLKEHQLERAAKAKEKARV